MALSYYRANLPPLAQDSRFLLACTQSLLGNQRAFRELLPTRFGGEMAAGRALDGSFYSPIRDEGPVLNALVGTNLFITATGKSRAFYYLARAVSRGTFRLGPISAEAMYNADYHLYHGVGVVRVR